MESEKVTKVRSPGALGRTGPYSERGETLLEGIN